MEERGGIKVEKHALEIGEGDVLVIESTSLFIRHCHMYGFMKIV